MSLLRNTLLAGLLFHASAGLNLDCLCPPDTTASIVTFDVRNDFTPLFDGEFVSDIGFGFKLNITARDGGLDTYHPRIFDSDQLTHPNSPDLLVHKGNLLIIQQDYDGSNITPNDSDTGGSIFFMFDKPTDVLSIQLVDMEGTAQVFGYLEGKEKRTRTRAKGGREKTTEDLSLGLYDVEKLPIAP